MLPIGKRMKTWDYELDFEKISPYNRFFEKIPENFSIDRQRFWSSPMSDVRWYIQIEPGKKAGPVSFDKLQQLAAEGRFFPETKLRSTQEGAVWIFAKELDGLSFPKTEESGFEQAKVQESPPGNLLANLATETFETSQKSTESSKTPGSIFTADEASEEPSAEIKKPTIVIKPKKKTKSSGSKSSETKSTGGSKTGFTISIGASSSKKKSGNKTNSKDIPEDHSASDDEATSIIVGLDALPGRRKDISAEKSDQSSQAIKIRLAGAKQKKTESKASDIISEKVDFDVSGEPVKTGKGMKTVAQQESVKRKSVKSKTVGGESLMLKIAAAIFLLGAATAFYYPFVPKAFQAMLLGISVGVLGLASATVAWALSSSLPSLNAKIESLNQRIETPPTNEDGV